MARRLPKTFRGAAVMRGLGMNHKKHEALVEKHALSEFDATRTIYLVVADGCLYDTDEPRAFVDRDKAIRYARSCSNGNVDHRVLTVTQQVLVIGTENDL